MLIVTMVAMDLPHYSTKQLLLSVTWMCVGFAGIAFSFRTWDLPLNPSDDWLARMEPFVRAAARLVGWGVICLGVAPLVTTRRTASLLGEAFAFALPIGVLGVLLLPTPISLRWSMNHDELFELIPWIVFAVASGGYIVVVAFQTDPKRESNDPRKPLS